MTALLRLLPALLLAPQIASAVPPPPALPSALLALRADNCPVTMTGTARPYGAVPFDFAAPARSVLVLVLDKPDPRLSFDLSTAGGGRVISGAGFGTGQVWLALPAAGRYRLSVSAWNPVAKAAATADFSVRAYLRDIDRPGECPR